MSTLTIPHALLIGNGPSAAKHELGEIIDRFEIVIRLNTYTLPGFEKQLGRHHYWWACTPQAAITMPALDPPCAHAFIFVFPGGDLQRDLDWVTARKKHYGRRCTIIETDQVTELAHKHGWPDVMSVWPSTGAMALAYFMERFPFVVIHGFDYLANSTLDDGTPHYYSEPGLHHSGCHDPIKEEAFFIKSITDKRAKVLTDFVATL